MTCMPMDMPIKWKANLLRKGGAKRKGEGKGKEKEKEKGEKGKKEREREKEKKKGENEICVPTVETRRTNK